MTELDILINVAANKEAFQTLQDFADFSLRFLDYIQGNKQAETVAQNDHKYRFFQFGAEALFKVSRPFNADILYHIDEADNQYKVLGTISESAEGAQRRCSILWTECITSIPGR